MTGQNRMKLRNGGVREWRVVFGNPHYTNNLNLKPVDYNLEPRHPIGQYHSKRILSTFCEILDTGTCIFFEK